MRDWILNIVILFLVGGLIRISLKTQKGNKKDPGKYVVQYHKIIKTIAIINMIFATYMFVTSMGTFIGIWEIGKNITLWVVMSFGIYFVFAVICIMGLNIWKITVENEKVTYTNYFGIKKYYNFKEIEVNLFENRKIIVTQEGKKIFKIDNNLNAADFLNSAVRYKVLKKKF